MAVLTVGPAELAGARFAMSPMANLLGGVYTAMFGSRMPPPAPATTWSVRARAIVDEWERDEPTWERSSACFG